MAGSELSGVQSIPSVKDNPYGSANLEAGKREHSPINLKGSVNASKVNAYGAAVRSKGKELGQLSRNQIAEVIDDANLKMQVTNTRCEFQYHEKSKRVSIKVIDQDTEEVIKEIPPEESIRMVEKMWELAGLYYDEKG